MTSELLFKDADLGGQRYSKNDGVAWAGSLMKHRPAGRIFTSLSYDYDMYFTAFALSKKKKTSQHELNT